MIRPEEVPEIRIKEKKAPSIADSWHGTMRVIGIVVLGTVLSLSVGADIDAHIEAGRKTEDIENINNLERLGKLQPADAADERDLLTSEINSHERDENGLVPFEVGSTIGLAIAFTKVRVGDPRPPHDLVTTE